MASMKQAPAFDEGSSTQHRVDRHHPPGEQAKAGAGETSDRPFGEHAQPFLHAFVTGETILEERQPLLRAVEISQEMDADLVRKQGGQAMGRHHAVGTDVEASAGYHEAADIVANSDVGTEIAFGAVSRDEVARGSGDRGRVDHLSARRIGIGRGKDDLGVLQQGVVDTAVEKHGRWPERSGVAGRKHGELRVEFPPFLAEQVFERRILERGQVDRVKVALGLVGIDGQRTIMKLRLLFAFRAEEFGEGDSRVDRRN